MSEPVLPTNGAPPKLARAISRLAEHGDDSKVQQPLTDVLESAAVEAATSTGDAKAAAVEEPVLPIDASTSLEDLLGSQKFCDEWEKQACLMVCEHIIPAVVFAIVKPYIDRRIFLTSSDGCEFAVDEHKVMLSTLIRTAVEAGNNRVVIPGVRGVPLDFVVQYLEHHNGKAPEIIAKPLRSKLMKDNCADPWDAEFIDGVGSRRQDLYDLILASNFLDVPGLLHLSCAKVASLIKGEPVGTINNVLRNDDDGTPSGSRDKDRALKTGTKPDDVGKTKKKSKANKKDKSAAAACDKDKSKSDAADGKASADESSGDDSDDDATDGSSSASAAGAGAGGASVLLSAAAGGAAAAAAANANAPDPAAAANAAANAAGAGQ